MENITRLPGMAHLSDTEYEAFISKERKEYRKRLKMICPFKDIRKQAEKMAAELASCEYCLYANGDDGCCVPHTEAYIEAMDINPCYEGVLLRLCKDAERKIADCKEAADETAAELKRAYKTIYGNLETISVLCNLIINGAKNKKPLCPDILCCIRSLSETTQVIMDDWDFCEDKTDEADFDNDDDWDFYSNEDYKS